MVKERRNLLMRLALCHKKWIFAIALLLGVSLAFHGCGRPRGDHPPIGLRGDSGPLSASDTEVGQEDGTGTAKGGNRGDGTWTAKSGNVFFSSAGGRIVCPIATTRCVVLMEREVKKREFRSWPRDDYFVSAFDTATGNRLFRQKIEIDSRPFQVHRIWPWRDKVVLSGFTQNKAGMDSRLLKIIVLNASGETVSVLEGLNDFRGIEIDEERGWLIGSSIGGQDKAFELVAMDLTTGQEVYRRVQEDVVADMATDRKGHFFLLKWTRDEKRDLHYRVEKVRLEPWSVLWSTDLMPPEGRPHRLKYNRGKLYYSIYNSGWRNTPGGRVRWIAQPLDSITGEPIETLEECDPYRIDTTVDGVSYAVTRDDNGVVWRRMTDITPQE